MERDELECPNCGDGFTARHSQQRFCSPGCKKLFHNRALGEGAKAIQLAKAWVGTRHAKPGTPEAEICRTARRELTTLARMLNDQDKRAGRPPASHYVASLTQDDRHGRAMVIDRKRK